MVTRPSTLRARWLYTTESETGSTQAGSPRRRDSLRKEAEFSTRGMEPHEPLFDAEGKLVVANGGIPTDAAATQSARLGRSAWTLAGADSIRAAASAWASGG